MAQKWRRFALTRAKRVSVVFATILLCLILTGQASAHALLKKAEPSPSAHLDSSPPRICLTFNERMEKGLYNVKVLGQNGKSVTNQQAKMSEDQRQLTLNLPALADGIYTCLLYTSDA